MTRRKRKSHKNYFGLAAVLIVIIIAAAAIFTLVSHKKTAEKPKPKTKVATSKKPKEKPVPKDPNPVNIPVLMYHSIAYEKNNELRVPKEKFREEMQVIKDNGFTPITLDDLYSHFTNETALPPKPLIISFDDGYKDNYENALPILKEFGFKACAFVITCQIDDSTDFMTSAMLKEMEANGVDIECHTVTHPHLSALSYDKQLVELRDSKTKLEKLLNKKINYIAYPYGSYNSDTVKLAESLGYKMAFTTNEGPANKSQGMFTLDRVYVSNANSVDYFKKQITGEVQ
ncbi:polysaccharide deacetylase family protein [Clostridium hydrogenum]|uniref:polysaccharide deacetylase family protein n=1 Tax=Clostridium hydrogenum TaxID=2855764 RepID=UPI001F3C8F1D|nr:polysaccharide deacetylase family protein [Clostridium hydrogenum]